MLELVRLNNEKLARQLAHVLGREGIRTREEAGDGEDTGCILEGIEEFVRA